MWRIGSCDFEMLGNSLLVAVRLRRAAEKTSGPLLRAARSGGHPELQPKSRFLAALPSRAPFDTQGEQGKRVDDGERWVPVVRHNSRCV
jgi:hypothetical protein